MQAKSIIPFFYVLLQCHFWMMVIASDKLDVVYQWKQLEYEWPSNDTELLFPGYKQEDNLPLGLEITSTRIFVTVPRWRRGVVASLNYFYRNGNYHRQWTRIQDITFFLLLTSFHNYPWNGYTYL